MNGWGKMTWADGREYDGNFVNDNKEGYGVYKWNEIKKYEGNWKNNK